MLRDHPPQILRQSEYLTQPWKNGGGTTFEIARSPDSAGEWNWRVSMALVEKDGPFSFFPGVDRTILLVEGEMTLTSPEGSHPLTANTPFHFRGEAPIEGRLHSPAARDLNVMVRREWGKASVSVTRGGVIRGPAIAVALEDTRSFQRFDSLRVEAGAEHALESADRALFLLVEFTERPSQISE